MKICFVLPQMLKKPIGGYKMVYEYANGLCDKGYEVSILYLNEKALARFPIPQYMKKLAIHYFTQNEPKWFKLDKQIKKLSSTDDVQKELPEVDVVIATGADTVYRTLDMFPDAKKCYFIQGYETWLFSEEELHKTYKIGMKNIVISKWLKDIVDRYSEYPAALLRNPVDTEKYRVRNEIQNRDGFSLGVLYHDAKNKGFQYAYEAITKVREIYPKIKLYMFGTTRPDFEIPEWVEFTLNATQEQTINIYNKVSVFVCATIREGFGLTGLEAMACGAALASTDYDGVREYAIDGYNALLSPVRDADALKENIVRLIEDKDCRKHLAINGVHTSKDFSFKNALNELEEIINEC